MRYLTVFAFALGFSFYVEAQGCFLSLDVDHYEYNTAFKIIKARTPKGEVWHVFGFGWIEALSYRACEHGNGFLFMHTSSGSYMFQNIPEYIYSEWISAADPGVYFHEQIKGKEDYVIPLFESRKSQCSADNRINGLRCKRKTYHFSGLCWQHQ